ncbi:glycosyltransferase family 1 protein [Prosthecochloris sp. SCSIO W1102]|uniref:glycosyltransferase family 4 protein n=1 Tax=Prosthecochloris sp. SCSIO W1102 TaxID=2992243 RepID=UPI00223D3022|nr:glycosyltransferase family 1 protein [Prosthecochloris sp. SCSIO W1102]UZJ39051.1 glycosyltransferase family 1 protein [Prosthecochloris sp. SCSIO W1102]
MKIALYAGTYVKDKDGAVRSMYQLVTSFLEAGHEVMVWSPDVASIDERHERVIAIPSVPIPLYPDYKLGFFTASTETQLDDFGPDIVQISTPDIVGNRFLKYAEKRGLPVVSVYHTDFPSYLDYYKLGFTKNFVWKHLRKFYNACDALFAPTYEMKTRLESKGMHSVDVWGRGIDRTLFNPDRRSDSLRNSWGVGEKTVIAYAGRFVWYKDIRIVMEVYDGFRRSRLADDVLFVMIGSGPEEEELRQRMPNAVFPGYLVGTDLPEAYASSDLFLFPSTTEAFGNVVLEGFSSGLPAVVSNVGGCQELVRHSDGGFVAEAGNHEQFFDFCTQLILDKGLYRKKRQNGLELAEKMSWPVINGALIEKYEEIIRRKAKKKS